MKKRSFLLTLKLAALTNLFFATSSVAAFKDVKFELGRALFFDKILVEIKIFLVPLAIIQT